MSTSMNRTVTALFDTREEAIKAIEELVRAGIPRSAVRMTPESAPPVVQRSSDTRQEDKGFWASLADLFMPDEDRYTYTEALNRGSILVSVSVAGNLADRAEDILEQRGTVNVSEREASWRKEGWTGYPAGNAAVGASGRGASSTLASGAASRDLKAGEQVVPEIEERLRVGKRQVNSGRVKVRSYVVETPVSEQVSLHSETVRVERRPADRAVGVGEDAFRERTIEAVATSEEAVIAKEARVTGEVVVKKDATDRTQTVTDKVRSTKVEVQGDRTGTMNPAKR